MPPRPEIARRPCAGVERTRSGGGRGTMQGLQATGFTVCENGEPVMGFELSHDLT